MNILKDQQNYEEEIEQINKHKIKRQRSSIKSSESIFNIAQNIQIAQNIRLALTSKLVG